MISDIRSYFRSIIQTVDSDMKEHKSPVISTNIPDNSLENTYFLSIGTTTISRLDTINENETECMLELYKNGYSSELENYDTAYCKAIEILREATDKTNIAQNNQIKGVDASSISVEVLQNNDNAYKFSIQFSVKTYF
jgi:hypothetical protein